MSKINNWKVVIDKIRKKLADWKSKFISFGGKLTLVKSVLGSLSLYYFSLFRAPRGVIRELERVRSLFFWGGGRGSEVGKAVPWVKWEKVVQDLYLGGLNVGCLQQANWALLAKWWWRFYVEKGAFWVKIIKSIYGPKGDLEGDGRSVNGRGSVWSNIRKVGRELDKCGIDFSRSFGVKVGNGRETSMWEDRWLDGMVLSESFNRLHQLENKKDASLDERGRWVGDKWVWEWDWRREPRGREVGELENLLLKVGDWKPKEERRDRAKWLLGAEGGYTSQCL